MLDELTDQAEDFICKQNKVQPNQKRRSYYFYQYLNIYHQTATENHNIANLSKIKVIEYIAVKVINIHYLVCIITYFDIIKD